jgi:hypothetical protein
MNFVEKIPDGFKAFILVRPPIPVLLVKKGGNPVVLIVYQKKKL